MVWLILAAVLAGIVGGMGMGGGTVYIPLLTQGLGLGQHLAQWLNLISFVPMAGVSLLIHARHRLLDKRGFWTLLIPSAVSTVVAALLAVRTTPRILGIVFAFFLSAMGAWGLVSTVRQAVLRQRRNTPREPEDIPDEIK